MKSIDQLRIAIEQIGPVDLLTALQVVACIGIAMFVGCGLYYLTSGNKLFQRMAKANSQAAAQKWRREMYHAIVTMIVTLCVVVYVIEQLKHSAGLTF